MNYNLFSTFSLFKTRLEGLMRVIDKYLLYLKDNTIESGNPINGVFYNGIIISIYGYYEKFINDICGSHIKNVLSNDFKNADYCKKLNKFFLSNLGEYLTNPQRYSNIDYEPDDLFKFFLDKETNNEADIPIELFLKHSANLQTDHTFEFINHVAINDVKTFLLHDEIFVLELSEIFSEEIDNIKTRLSNSLKNNEETTVSIFSEFNEIVAQRNSIAHSGLVDNRRSYPKIKTEILPFIIAFASSLFRFLLVEDNYYAIQKDKLITFIPDKIFNNKIMCFEESPTYIKKYDFFLVINGDGVKINQVLNIQINDENVEKCNSGDNIGILTNGTLNNNSKIIFIS